MTIRNKPGTITASFQVQLRGPNHKPLWTK
jgi:hypothetical protein